jgi:hypothetical protein
MINSFIKKSMWFLGRLAQHCGYKAGLSGSYLILKREVQGGGQNSDFSGGGMTKTSMEH